MNMYERPSEKARAATNSMRRSAAEKAYELLVEPISPLKIPYSVMLQKLQI